MTLDDDLKEILANLVRSMLANTTGGLVARIEQAIAAGKLLDSDIDTVTDLLLFAYRQGIDDAAEAIKEMQRAGALDMSRWKQ